jgi:HSP20 family protein
MAIVKWSPWQELEAMERRMRRVFDDAGFVTPAVLPNADVYETDAEFVVELEVPGFEEKELDIEVTDHTLCVKGARTEQKEQKDKAFQRRERLERSFERRFALPEEVDTAAITAKYAKGVLEVHAAKATAQPPTKVTIGTA